MPPTAARPVIVVLGSGRSGTSLLMQVLAVLGMGVSEELIQARRDNPEGFFEDAPIVRIQADLLRALGAWPYHPLPADWLELPATAAAREALRTVLGRRLGLDNLWGFKDPRTAAFLPVWQQLFAEEGLMPKYILALREPGSVIRSFMRAYDTPPEVAERVWLQRVCDALWHTRGECHIVHYEDWFRRPRDVAEGLARHTGLPEVAEAVLLATVKPGLDRAGGVDYVMVSEAARRLDDALQTCRGGDFDRESLLRTVVRCRKSTKAAWPSFEEPAQPPR